MKRASLPITFILCALPIALSAIARAAEPPATGASADPFAPPPEGKPPSTTEDQEAALLAAPDKPTPPPSTPPPPPRRPVAATGAREPHQFRDEERTGGGLAIELSTSGFASGALMGGVFVGGHTASGTIVGGILDYGLTSLTATPDTGAPITISEQTLRLGAGVRQPIVRSADRRVDLYGAADAAFVYKGAEAQSTMAGMPTATGSAAGFSLALGPGLRLWVHDQIAIGYVARLRITYLSGEQGALAIVPNDNPTDASLTEVRFDGAFQILGVF
jgi:hypothetical protein